MLFGIIPVALGVLILICTACNHSRQRRAAQAAQAAQEASCQGIWVTIINDFHGRYLPLLEVSISELDANAEDSQSLCTGNVICRLLSFCQNTI